MGQLQRRNAELVDLLSADFVNCWMPIKQIVLSETVSFVMFEDIPQNFRALVLSGQARTNRVAESDVLRVEFNEDSGNNYAYFHVDFYCADTTSTDCDRNAISIQTSLCEAKNSRTDSFSPFSVVFPGYARSNWTKWAELRQGGRMGNLSLDADMQLSLARGLWKNLEPVTSIMVYPGIGPSFVPKCIFELYGVL